MENLISYAQWNEDIIIYNILKGVSKVFWIDIGANDPVDMSVTKFFYDRGGNGINVEPQKVYIDRMNKERRRDINLAFGISNKRGSMMMWGRGGEASLDPNAGIKCRYDIPYKVPVITLREIENKYIKKYQDIHFLKIDVEGLEKECLEGADFKNYRPWVLCIESTEPGSDIPMWDKWESIIVDEGYLFVGMSKVNRYYVACEHKELVENFLDIDELKNKYCITDYNSKTKKNRLMREKIYFAAKHPLICIKAFFNMRKMKILR